MNLYWLPEEHQYVRTQGEAGKRPFVKHDVKVDQPSLMALLNELYAEIQALQVVSEDATEVRERCDVCDTILMGDEEHVCRSHEKPAPAPVAVPYTIQSCELDRAFLAAPMAHRLTLISITAEEMRSKWPPHL